MTKQAINHWPGPVTVPTWNGVTDHDAEWVLLCPATAPNSTIMVVDHNCHKRDWLRFDGLQPDNGLLDGARVMLSRNGFDRHPSQSIFVVGISR